VSLDFNLYALRETCVLSDTNATHNLTPMWSKAGVYDALYNSAGKLAGEVPTDLQKGLSHMRRNRSVYEALAPENGWGDYETALDFLTIVVAACDTNPDAKIWVSK
jgi:hypothetical protein